MAAQRLKGQETELSFTDPLGGDEPLGPIQSFEAELDIEVLSEGYLGETADRKDDIFNGVSGSATIHLDRVRYFRFTELVQNRAQRRTPASGVFNVQSTFNFPSGEVVRISFEDIFFGALPLSVSGRGDYVSATIPWECSSITRLL